MSCSQQFANVSPGIVRPGERVAFELSGFRPSSRVDVRIAGPGLLSAPSFSASPDCRIEGSFTLPRAAEAGNYSITGTGVSDAGVSVEVQTAFSVVGVPAATPTATPRITAPV